MPGRRARFAWAIGPLLAVMSAVPSSPSATLVPEERSGPQQAAVVADERARLAEVRERLARRVSLQRALDAQVSELERRLRLLRVEGEAAGAALARGHEEAGRLERRLDYLVPRLVAHKAEQERTRAKAAHVLAELAGLSRQVELDPRVKARLLAVSPLMLARLRKDSPALDGLGELRDRAVARQRALRAEQPRLRAVLQRVERARAEAARERAVLLRRRAPLGAELAALREEQARLAGELLIQEAARVVRADPQPDEPALPAPAPGSRPAGPGRGAVAVKGVAGGWQAFGSVDALHEPGLAQAVAVAPRAPARFELEPAHALLVLPAPPPAKPAGDVEIPRPGVTEAGVGRASLAPDAALDLALAEPIALIAPASRVAPGRLDRPQPPIMPVPGQIIDRFGEGDARSSITIAAGPGQAVAAPEQGRIAFAGAFRSYGLLLIIEHDREYHTLLWGLSKIDVATGDQVRAGQVIGAMGAGTGSAPELHVELRRNGRPVNPLPWLAASNSKVRG